MEIEGSDNKENGEMLSNVSRWKEILNNIDRYSHNEVENEHYAADRGEAGTGVAEKDWRKMKSELTEEILKTLGVTEEERKDRQAPLIYYDYFDKQFVVYLDQLKYAEVDEIKTPLKITIDDNGSVTKKEV